MSIKKAYPDLGRCLYFDLSSGTHSVFYELLNKRMNWILYVNQPEPQVKVIACSYPMPSAFLNPIFTNYKSYMPLLKVIVLTQKRESDVIISILFSQPSIKHIVYIVG